MKNIHLLPTDKPSRLFVYDGKLGLAKESQYGSDAIQNQNIYITNSEEIKEGDWFTDNNNSLKRSYKLSHVQFANPKKIILTTDQDLIADGTEQISEDTLLKIVEHINSGKKIESFNEL
jgi:hypothetical protein